MRARQCAPANAAPPPMHALPTMLRPFQVDFPTILLSFSKAVRGRSEGPTERSVFKNFLSCWLLFSCIFEKWTLEKRKEQVENSAIKNPDRFLIPHQTPHQLTKTKQGSTQNNSPVSNKPTTSISTNKNDKPLSMANLPTGLLQNIEKFTKNSHTNNIAQKMPTPNGISSNGSSTSDDMLTIDINKPGPSGFNSKKSDSNTNSVVMVEQTSKEIQTSKPNSTVCKPTDSPKSPSTAIVGSSVNIPNIMDTIAGGKCISLNTNIPPSLDDIRRALEDDKTPSECEKKNVKSTEKSQPDKAVIDKIIGK